MIEIKEVVRIGGLAEAQAGAIPARSIFVFNFCSEGQFMKTVVIDGVEYQEKQTANGNRCVVVVDRGWIFA